MSFKDLYEEKILYCGVELSSLDKYNPSVKVCNGHDFYSSISYKKLIENNKHLPFYSFIKENYSFFHDQQIGILIRWLYRGLTLELAIRKVRNDYEITQKCIKKSVK